jgi:hypothetical protein
LVIALAALVDWAQAACGVLTLYVGAICAFASAHLVKRLLGVFMMGVGALIVLAALGASLGLALGVAAALAAWTMLGAAILIRLQEDYGGLEAADVETAEAERTSGGEQKR